MSLTSASMLQHKNKKKTTKITKWHIFDFTMDTRAAKSDPNWRLQLEGKRHDH